MKHILLTSSCPAGCKWEMLSSIIIREMFEEMEESQEARENGEPGAQTESTQGVRQRVCREKPSRPVVVRVSLFSSTGYSLEKANDIDIVIWTA